MADLSLSYDSFGRLVVELPGGEQHVGVVPVRAYPFSAPTELISLVDEQGHEVYLVRNLSDLPSATQSLLKEDLKRREFMPVIQKIHSVSSSAEPSDWLVTTDRGQTTFTLTSEDHIRRLPPDGALIADEHGIRYRIMDLAALDAHSRRILRWYL
jgi:hypothetical protein